MSLSLRLVGGQVLRPEGLGTEPLSFADGVIADGGGRDVDLSGYMVLPGIVDVHGDGFERHVAPRRGAMKDMDQGIMAAEAELAANGITTAVLAQFYSWEGGMRGPDFAEKVLAAIAHVRDTVVTDLRAQLRFETHMLDDYDTFADMVARYGIGYVVFNDHLPHAKLAAGKRPPRMTGQALKSGRNPDAHLALMQALHARSDEVPNAVGQLSSRLTGQGVRLGSHDDKAADQRATWRTMGVRVSEFPETLAAAEAAHHAGDHVVLGAPNVVRGGSHNGNVSATDLLTMGYGDALASDYHYPSPRRAAFFLADSGVRDLAGAWALVSSGPARVLGLEDRGTLASGKRADLVIVETATRRVAATLSAGRISYMSGDVAARFLA